MPFLRRNFELRANWSPTRHCVEWRRRAKLASVWAWISIPTLAFCASSLLRAEDDSSSLWTGGPLLVKWEADAGRAIVESPILVDDRLYVPTTDRKLHCYDLETGDRLWKKKFKERLAVAPTYTVHGGALGSLFVYYGHPEQGWLARVDAETGDEEWREEALPRPVYLEAEQNELFSLDLDGYLTSIIAFKGEVLWEIEGFGWDPPAFLLEEKELFVLSRTDSLHSVDREKGTKTWGVALEGRFVSPPRRIGLEIVVTNTEGRLYRIDPTSGDLLGTQMRDSMQLVAPVHHRGQVVTASSSGVIESRSLEGEGWRYESGYAFEASPVSAGPLLLVPTSRGNLLALDAEEGTFSWSISADSRLKVSPIFTDQYLILATGKGDIYVYDHR